MEVDFAAAAPEAGIGTRWARARIAALEQSRLHGADPLVVRAEVVDLAKRFSLVTPYTSFVVVAEEAYAADAPSGEEKGAMLPQGGTDEPLLLAAGIALAVAGSAVLAAAVRRRELAA